LYSPPPKKKKKIIIIIIIASFALVSVHTITKLFYFRLVGLQEDLEAVLRKIELKLVGYGLGWENVLYIHLYIADMDKFSIANETYVRFITQEKCPFGVPSRSTIELPLLQVGLGSAYIEVLVANDQSKRVLHVQSISCWAPSCIGPYSQVSYIQLSFFINKLFISIS
jgi:hypothetical protein